MLQDVVADEQQRGGEKTLIQVLQVAPHLFRLATGPTYRRRGTMGAWFMPAAMCNGTRRLRFAYRDSSFS